MKKIKLRDLLEIGIVASIYIALTLILYPLSYGTPQFRISECLVLLSFFNKKYGIGVTLGVLIANFFSPIFGLYDLLFGTLSTLLAVILMSFTKKLFIASIMPVLTSVIVVVEAWLFTDLPFYLCLIEITGSMIIIEMVIGYILFKLLMKNKNFMNIVTKK